MDREIELFIQDYLKEIREDNAAIFAGAIQVQSATSTEFKNSILYSILAPNHSSYRPRGSMTIMRFSSSGL